MSYFINQFARRRRVAYDASTHDFKEIQQFAMYSTAEEKDELEKRLRALPYRDFLKTFYWRAIKARVVHTSGARCARCRKTGHPVDVHHVSYDFHGREHEHLDLLVVMCRPCHEKEHRPNPGCVACYGAGEFRATFGGVSGAERCQCWALRPIERRPWEVEVTA